MRWRCGCVLRSAKYISYHLHPPHLGGRFTSLNMTPEQKRIAIAEACGWRGISEQFLVGYAPWRTKPYADRVKSCSIADLDSIPLDPLPDYCNDLNAMHEAENKLTPFQRIKHGHFLQETLNEAVVGFVSNYESELKSLSRVASATAAQRAEAFGKTLNLW